MDWRAGWVSGAMACACGPVTSAGDAGSGEGDIDLHTNSYGDAAFMSVACVDQCLVIAGDALGNVWFINLPDLPRA
jgi:hypothetical protein